MNTGEESDAVVAKLLTKEVLDTIKVGDLIKINNWKKPMRIKGVSKNYAVMIRKQFSDTYYSVIEKKPRTAGDHNEMRKGLFHCGKDDYIFGATEFQYKFDDADAVAKYLNEFETGESQLSVRNAIPILEIHIKSHKEALRWEVEGDETTKATSKLDNI